MLDPQLFNCLVPEKMHINLESNNKSRVIIVGDIHGCYDEFQELLRHTHFNPENDSLVLVGDLVNKGPKSPQVIQLARQLAAHVVRGNHDDTVLRAWVMRRKLHERGEDPSTLPLLNKFNWLDSLSNEDFEWMRSLPYTISIPTHNAIVVHAGLVPDLPLAHQSIANMSKMRNLIRKQLDDGSCIWEGTSADDVGEPWASVWSGKEHVYFGHDAKRRLQRHNFATGLDTGCCYGGQLTACILPGNHIFSYPAKNVYQPIET